MSCDRGLIVFDGLASDRDVDGMLDSGDILPDLDDNGIIAALKNDVVTGEARGDLFDNRSAEEKADAYSQRGDVAPGGGFFLCASAILATLRT